MLSLNELRQVEQLIISAARQEIIPRYQQVESHHKADGSLLTEADLAMQSRVLGALAEQFPQFARLGEEMSQAQQSQLMGQHAQGLWVLDPLDGTANFASGIPYFGISLALLGDHQIQAGIVYDPLRDELFSALLGQGAWLNGSPLRVPEQAPPLREAMGLVDLKRLPESMIVQLARTAPYRSQRSFGSVALDWCWLAAARVQVYLHGGQRLWDYAAGSLILREAGGSGGLYEDYAGTPLGDWVLLPRIAIAATGPALFEQWQQWLQAST